VAPRGGGVGAAFAGAALVAAGGDGIALSPLPLLPPAAAAAARREARERSGGGGAATRCGGGAAAVRRRAGGACGGGAARAARLGARRACIASGRPGCVRRQQQAREWEE
jgi:hypothetical protein